MSITESQRQAIEAVLAPHRSGDAPGGSVSIALHGRIVLREAFGLASLEHGVTNTVATAFPVGSICKQFVAAALLQLQAARVLSLDDPIGRWVKGLSHEQASPTLRQLLRHTGGVRCYLDQWVLDGYTTMPTGVPARIQRRQQTLNFAPGSGSSYSNGGYLLLSLAVEAASGLPLGEYLRGQFFEPLGMTATRLPASRWPVAQGVASIYLRHVASGGWRAGLAIAEDLYGDGDLVSTPDDLLTWARFLREDRDVCWRSLLDGEDDVAMPSYRLGVIWERWRRVRVMQHAGGLPGASASWAMLPDEGLDVAVALNRSGDAIGLGQQLMQAVLGERLGATPAAPLSADHSHLLGRYFCDATGFLFALHELDGKLGLSLFGGSPFPLEACDAVDGSWPFGADVGTGGIRFRPAARGKTIEYSDGVAWYEARRLGVTPPIVLPMAAELTDEFVSDAAAASLTVVLGQGRLKVQVRGEYGQGIYEAEAIAEDMLRFWPALFPGGMVVRLVRNNGAIVALDLSTSRTRATRFTRRERL